MKNVLRQVIWVFFLVVYTDISAAASSSSSSCSAKRTSPEGERVTDQREKKLRTSSSRAGKKSLVIMRDEYVPGGRGKVQIREEIALLEQDHITHKTFFEHIKEDRARNLPWVVALITYENENGSFARDYADGRYWHQYLKNNATNRHPLYNRPLIGYPIYYAVRVVDNKLNTEYLGTEKEVGMPLGILLRALLELEPTGATFWDIGYGYEQKQELDKAISSYERAVSKLREEGKPYGPVLVNLGNIYRQKRDWDKAIEFYQQAHEQLYAEGKPYGQVLEDLGNAYSKKGDWDKAIEFYQQAHEQLQAEGKPYGQVLVNLGNAYNKKRDWDKAIEFYQQVNEQLRAEGKPYGQVLLYLGHIYSRKKDWDKAIEFYQQAHEQLLAVGKPYGQVLEGLGYAYWQKRDWDKALEFYLQAHEQLRAESKPYGQVLLYLGHIYSRKKDWDKAIEICLQMIELLRAEGKPYGHVLANMGYAYEQKGEFNQAGSYYINALEQENPLGLLHVLYLYGAQKIDCKDIPDAKCIEYAQRFVALPLNNRWLVDYKENYPERFAVAQEAAKRLVAGAQELQDDAQSSSSEQ